MLRRLHALMQKTLAVRAERGPYRFLVRRWDKLSDLDLATRVLDTEFFAKELQPLSLPIAKLRSILVLAPHQDDEAIGAGGSLLLAAAAGVKIDVLYVTDGAAKNPTYATDTADSIRIRSEEAQSACSKLNASMYRLDMSNLDPKPSLFHLERLSEIINTLNPQVIMMPWILDSPAKHRLLNHLLWLADRYRGLPDCEIWGFQVHNTLLPNGYVDITEVADRKLELLRCFKSQNEFGQRYDHLAMGLSAWNARFLERSNKPRYVEVFFTLPLRELFRLVESFYFRDLRSTYRGESKVIEGIQSLHRIVIDRRARERKNGGSGTVGRDSHSVTLSKTKTV